jgi:hypothetical protein
VLALQCYAFADQPPDFARDRIDTDSDPDPDKPSTTHELTMSRSVKFQAISGSAVSMKLFKARRP